MNKIGNCVFYRVKNFKKYENKKKRHKKNKDVLLCVYNFSFYLVKLGDDWECTLGDKKKPVSTPHSDENDTIKVDSLNYLKQQINGYGTSADRVNETLDEDDDDYLEMDNETILDDNDENLDGSGDGDKEDKAAFIPIPMNKDPQGVVASHLQRLSQLIKAMSNKHNKTTELGPNDLNQFLAAHKIKIGGEPMYGLTSLSQVSIPGDGKIHPSTMAEILDLQEKIQKLGALRDSLSTTPTPVDHVVMGSGYYNPDATTLHIKTSNSVKSPRFPDAGIAPSQIVVNRPDGSVLFSLSHAGQIAAPDKEPYISEETLKTVLELSHQMASTNNPPTYGHYLPEHHSYVQPLIRPIYYNVPIQELPGPLGIADYESSVKDSYSNLKDSYNNLKDSYNNLKDSFSISLKDYGGLRDTYGNTKDVYTTHNNNNHNKKDDKTMQKLSSINGYLDTDEHFIGEVPSTIIHNHIPITISNPNPLNSVLTGLSPTTTTAQPENSEFDSYGSKIPPYNDHKSDKYGTKYTDLNDYYPYPPYNDPPRSTSSTYEQIPNNYQSNKYSDNKQYIQISQSKPETDDEVFFGSHHSHARPVLNLDALGPTSPTVYSSSPHLNDKNVNDFVNIDAKPFSTLQPTDYKPFKYHSHSSASSPSNNHYITQTKLDSFYQQNSGQAKPAYITKLTSSPINSYIDSPKPAIYQQESSKPLTYSEVSKPFSVYDPHQGSSLFENFSSEQLQLQQTQQQQQQQQQYQAPKPYQSAQQYSSVKPQDHHQQQQYQSNQQYDQPTQFAPQYERPQSYQQPLTTTQAPPPSPPLQTSNYNSQPLRLQHHSQFVEASLQPQSGYTASTPEPPQAPPQPINNYESIGTYNAAHAPVVATSRPEPSNVFNPQQEELSLFSEYGNNNNVYQSGSTQLDDNTVNYDNENNQQQPQQQLEEYDSGSFETSYQDEEVLPSPDLNTDDVTGLLTNLAQQTTKPLHTDKKPLFEYNPSQSDNHKQFVNLGGNFISLETYQNSIEPFLHDGALLNSNIEVLTCATGVRQANSSDCTKYFVCNSNTGKVLSYTCPPYTAFNSDTKICNAKTYADCVPGGDKNHISLTENKRIQQEAQQALLEANRVKANAIKQQKLANMIKLQTQKILTQASQQMKKPQLRPAKASATPNKHHSTKIKHQNAQNNSNGSSSSSSESSSSTSSSGKRKRRVACKGEGKLADKLSSYNYFICFKDKAGKMKARKMTCPSGLMFCSSTKMCTSYKRCYHKH